MGHPLSRLMLRFVQIAFFGIAVIARAQSPAPFPTPDLSTLSFTGPNGVVAAGAVSMIGTDAAGGIFIGGPFTQVNATGTVGVARLNPDGTLDASWVSGLPNGAGTQAIVDAKGQVVMAVLFANTWRVWLRASVSSLTVLYNSPSGMMISALASDSRGFIYAAEQTGGSSGSARVYKLARDGTGPATDFNVTVTGASTCEISQSFVERSLIYRLLVDSADRLYIAGDFTGETTALGGPSATNTIAGSIRIALNPASFDTTWNPLGAHLYPAVAAPHGMAKMTCIPQPTKVVHDMAVPGDGFVYLAGSFGGALTRYVESTSYPDAGWRPGGITAPTNAIPVITAIAVDSERHRLYAGSFWSSFENGQKRLAAFWLFPGAVQDTTWSPPQPDGAPLLHAVAAGRLDVGGNFTGFGPTTRIRLAAFPLSGTSIIANYYQTVLGRAPDAAGAAFWGNTATHVAALGVSPNEAYIVMAMLFFSSPEFTATPLTDAQFVDKLYLTFFARPADVSGRDFWTSQMAAGLTREMVMFAFAFSNEFNAYMAANLDAPVPMRPEVGVVIDFYRGALSRLPDDMGLNFWVSQFRIAQCSPDPGTRLYQVATSMAESFFTSPEYTQSPPTPAAYVSDLYNAFLRRSADVSGFNYWVNQLATGGTTAAQARAAFIGSPEFNARVQAMAAAGCVAAMQ